MNKAGLTFYNDVQHKLELEGELKIDFQGRQVAVKVNDENLTDLIFGYWQKTEGCKVRITVEELTED
jgi:hypothetical protein